jgi:hypothetical protein
VWQEIADSLEKGDGKIAIIIDISKGFKLVLHVRLLRKLAGFGRDSRIVVWVREFFVGRTQRIREGGKEDKVNSVVSQGTVLGPLLFLVYVNGIWRNIDWSVRLFADRCIIYRKMRNINDIENLQDNLNTMREWAVEN